MTRVRRLIWVDPYLLNMVSDKGVDLSAFVNRALTVFLDVPEDPNEVLVKKNIEKAGIRCRILYEESIRSRILQNEQDQAIKSAEKTVQERRKKELEDLGNRLMQLSCWEKVRRALVAMDPDSDYWPPALQELNAMNGAQWELTELWNTAIDWWNQYGKAIA